MKLKNILPVALFCFVFLIYTLYFVKVVSRTTRLEPNAIANTIKRSWERKKSFEKLEILPPAAPILKSEPAKVIPKITPPPPPPQALPIATQYVNFTFLNVRREPSLLAPILEKIYKNAAVDVYAYPKAAWAEVKTAAGTRGYVSKKYLSENKSEPQVLKSEEPATVTVPSLYKIPIITYHHIQDVSGKYPADLSLATTNLLAQLDYLVAMKILTMTFHDLKAISEGKQSVSGKSVILAFDDGYADQYQVAQHLNGKGLKGVFFIITEKIGTPGYLDWRQVKKMRNWGMEIGSHGVKSANLIGSTEFFVKDELERSKRVIELELGEPIISFAYPSGRYNSAVLELTKKAGYTFARSIESGSQYKKTQFLKLPTLRVYSPAGAKQFKAWLGS